MNQAIKFGLRMPDFPLDGSRGRAFTDQMINFLEPLQGKLDSAWVADHFVPWATFQDPFSDTPECWTSLVYLAGRLPGLDFGTIVACQSYRNPALLAKMAATLQTFSGGRFILGIGAGWKKDEYLAYGYEFPSRLDRLYQLDEAVQIIRKLWREPKATYHGQYYHVEDAICQPKPDPLPPLMVGGGGKKITLRIAAQYADWWNVPGCSAETYQELLEVLRGHCQKVGRDYDQIVKTWCSDCVAIAPTHEAAVKLAESSPFYGGGQAIVGDPDEVAAQLQPFVDLGVQHFILRFIDFPSSAGAQLFASQVMPRFT
jgi:alkanesulfonate monooxygenase SsuD/methylene tetrahydromethanopterin reductase-like flavin-dependent oxidoreductase (luciferase family)